MATMCLQYRHMYHPISIKWGLFVKGLLVINPVKFQNILTCSVRGDFWKSAKSESRAIFFSNWHQMRTVFTKDLLYIIPAKFGLKWPRGFNRKDKTVISHRFSMGTMCHHCCHVCQFNQHKMRVYQSSILWSFKTFCLTASEEIFENRPNSIKKCPWRPCLNPISMKWKISIENFPFLIPAKFAVYQLISFREIAENVISHRVQW